MRQEQRHKKRVKEQQNVKMFFFLFFFHLKAVEKPTRGCKAFLASMATSDKDLDQR